MWTRVRRVLAARLPPPGSRRRPRAWPPGRGRPWPGVVGTAQSAGSGIGRGSARRGAARTATGGPHLSCRLREFGQHRRPSPPDHQPEPSYCHFGHACVRDRGPGSQWDHARALFLRLAAAPLGPAQATPDACSVGVGGSGPGLHDPRRGTWRVLVWFHGLQGGASIRGKQRPCPHSAQAGSPH